MPFDEKHFASGAFRFASRFNELQPVLLTGIFLSPVNYLSLWGYSAELYTHTLEEENKQVKSNIKQFGALCRKHHIEYRVHPEDPADLTIPRLRKESRFADLMLISSEHFYEHLGAEQPNDYCKEILSETECPIMVIPEKAAFPATNILAYDGTASSVFAIKSFAYLFPELCNNPTLLVYAHEKDKKELPDQTFIEELAARHFPDLTLYKLSFDPKKFFATWIKEEKAPILVCGAFGRSSFSQLFKKSFVTDLIREHTLPIFIAHT